MSVKTFDKLEGLMASIQAVGIVEVPTVMPIGNGKFQLITGHRRFEAWKRLGNDRIQVHIKDSEDDAHALRRKSIVSNVQRQDVNPVEMANALKELLDDANDIESQNDLSTAIGKPKAWVSGMLRILSLPPNLQTKVSRAKLKMSYDTVADIARLDNPTEQEIEGLCTHALRATAATNALDNDADIAKVQEWLGHSNISTTRLYDRRKTRPEESPTFKVTY